MEYLTDKAKIDFLKWMENKHDGRYSPKIFSLDLAETFYLASVIEWLDAQFIVVTISNMYYDGFHFQWGINQTKPVKSEHGFETRLDATKSAVQKANEIYNLTHQL